MYKIDYTNDEFIVHDTAIRERLLIEEPETALNHFLSLDWPNGREACWMLSLNTKHRLLSADLISVGSLDHTFMSPREIFGVAVRNDASAIILAHNHPSGEAQPSRDDERVTRRIMEAARIMGIELLDHLVIGHPSSSEWTSLARRGMM